MQALILLCGDAKEEGGNKSVFFTEEMPAVAVEKLVMYTDLVYGISNGQFYMVYQPQIDLKTEIICGAEALVQMAASSKRIDAA